MVFYGSTNNTSSALGNTYLVGNNNALDWGRVILGQTSAAVDDTVLLYKNGISISHVIELNETDAGGTTMGVTGTGANATQSGNITLNNFGGNFTKNLTLTADTSSSFTVTGQMTTANAGDTINLIKTGNGTVTLSHATGNLYTGSTTVSVGTLLVDNTTGSGTGTGAVTVATGATLGGTALLAPGAGNMIAINGTLAPGTGAAGTVGLTLTGASQLAFGAGSALAFDLGTASDLVAFTAAGDWLAGSGNVTLNLALGAGFSYANTYTIFSNVTTSGFALAGITGYDNVGFTANFAQNGSSYELSFTAIPEPSSVVLLVFAGLFLAYKLRRLRRQDLS